MTFNDAIEVAEKIVPAHSWKGITCQAAINGFVVTGCENGGYEEKVVVSDHDIKQHASAYEKETGKCWSCKGTKIVFHSWSLKHGTKTVPCEDCNETGKAKE